MTDTETDIEMPEGVTADDVKTIRAFCRAMGWPEPDVTPDFIELLGGELELHRGTIDIVVPYPGAKTAETIKAPGWQVCEVRCSHGGYMDPPDCDVAVIDTARRLTAALDIAAHANLSNRLQGIHEAMYGPEDFGVDDGTSEPPAPPPTCPHGEPWHECNSCMTRGDFLYDCQREARAFGRR